MITKMHSKALMPELSHHQWKLIFDAVRKQQEIKLSLVNFMKNTVRF